MKTMTARFPGTCCTCGNSIRKGDTINFYGKGRAAHLSCAGAQEDEHEPHEHDEDAAAGLEPGTLASDRRSAKNGLSVFRFSSGAVMTQNSKGRCEDAPCCGCCS